MAGDRWSRALVLTLVTLSSIVVGAPTAQAVGICPDVKVDDPEVGWVGLTDVAGVPGSDEAIAVGSADPTDDGWGAATLRRWNGTDWTVETVPVAGFTNSHLDRVDAVATHDIWAAASASNDQFTTETAVVMQWDGSNWTTHLPSLPADAEDGTMEILALDAVSASDVWVVGLYFHETTGARLGFVSHYNGSSWTVQTDVPTSRTLHGVYAAGSNDVWVVGRTNDGSLALHYDGLDWTALSNSDVAGQTAEAFYDVQPLGDDVWVVGSYGQNDETKMLARRWNGSSWTNYAMPNLGAFQVLSHITVTPGGELWAYGYNNSFVHSLVRFDGVRWVRYEDGMNEPFHAGSAIAATDGHLWLTQHYSAQYTRPLCVRATGEPAVPGLPADPPGDFDDAEWKTKTADPDPAVDGDNITTWIDLPVGVTSHIVVRETFVEPPSVDTALEVTSGTPTASNPIRLRFQLDATLYQAGRTGSIVRKDGVVVTPCSTSGQASPDPCVEPEVVEPNNDHTLIVNTTSDGLWTLSQSGPTATFITPTTRSGAISVTFNAEVQRLTSRNFDVLVDGVPVAGSITCQTSEGAHTECWDGSVGRVILQPYDPLIAGQAYVVRINPSGIAPIVDTNNVPVTSASRMFRGQLIHEDTSGAITYNWQRIDKSAAYGGSYRRSRLSKNKATYKTSWEDGLTVYVVKGPNMGKVDIRVNGTSRGVFDLYAPTTTYKVPINLAALGAGPHTVTLTPTGTKRSASTGTYVGIDAIREGLDPVQGTPPLSYTWQPVGSSLASGGRLVRYDLTGGSFQFTFRGTAIDWYTLKGPSQGKSRIRIDGVAVETYDAYRSSSLLVRKRISGLSNAVHTLRIEALGTRNSASSNTFVSMDRLVIP